MVQVPTYTRFLLSLSLYVAYFNFYKSFFKAVKHVSNLQRTSTYTHRQAHSPGKLPCYLGLLCKEVSSLFLLFAKFGVLSQSVQHDPMRLATSMLRVLACIRKAILYLSLCHKPFLLIL